MTEIERALARDARGAGRKTRPLDELLPLRTAVRGVSCEPVGSLTTMAPEVLAGRWYCPYRADAWSLGVCLFAMVSGFFPLDEARALLVFNNDKAGMGAISAADKERISAKVLAMTTGSAFDANQRRKSERAEADIVAEATRAPRPIVKLSPRSTSAAGREPYAKRTPSNATSPSTVSDRAPAARRGARSSSGSASAT